MSPFTPCSASGLLKRVNREMKFRWTVPVGPLRCLATMISDLALSFSDISGFHLVVLLVLLVPFLTGRKRHEEVANHTSDVIVANRAETSR